MEGHLEGHRGACVARLGERPRSHGGTPHRDAWYYPPWDPAGFAAHCPRRGDVCELAIHKKDGTLVGSVAVEVGAKSAGDRTSIIQTIGTYGSVCETLSRVDDIVQGTSLNGMENTLDYRAIYSDS